MSTPFTRIEEFLRREWPGSKLDDGYALVTLFAPVLRRFAPEQPEYPGLTGRRTLAERAFRNAGEIWLVSIGLDVKPFLGGSGVVERRDVWTTPDAGMHEKHEQYAATVAGGDCDLDAMVAKAVRAPHYLCLWDPERSMAVEPGWPARPVFAYASLPAPLDDLAASSPKGTWS